MEIKGKVNTAICYASVIEDEAVEQIRRMCDYEFTDGSRIRIMPDVHAGAGCTIGTTMTIRDKAVPNVVGVDIGCGMYTVRLKEAALDFEKIDGAAHFIPSGMNVWETPPEDFDLSEAVKDRAFAELLQEFEPKAAVRIYAAEKRADEAENSVKTRMSEQARSRSALPKSQRTDRAAAPAPDYMSMSKEAFSTLEKQYRNAAHNGKRVQI